MIAHPPSILVEKQMDPVSVVSSAHPSSLNNNLQHDTSDCGSSSGVGGMKDASHASDEENSSTEQQTTSAANATSHTLDASSSVPSSGFENNGSPRPPSLAINRFSVPPPALPLPITVPQFGPIMGAPPMGPSANDLFVHIQVGETLSIFVNGEIQHITGPATVRMVGEAGMQAPNTALPLHVPKGHVVHQIMDDQGFLRHIILSPEITRETSASPGAVPSTSAGTLRPSPSTMPPPSLSPGSQLSHLQPLQNQQPNFYTVNRQFPRGMAPERRTRVEPLLTPMGTPATILAQEPSADLDQEDIDRIREMCNRLMPPTILCLRHNEVEVAWQELDTSEASAAGGPYPQLDASEFTYQILVQEAGRIRRDRDIIVKVSNQNLRTAAIRSRAIVKPLLPNKEYTVQIQARLEERGIHGEYSPSALFKTPFGHPDSPSGLKAENVALDSLVLRWSTPASDGGSPIFHYTVYRVGTNARGEDEAEPLMQTRELWAKIEGLKPGTSYRFRVTATNRMGESGPCPPMGIMTRGDVVFLPTVVPCGPRAAKISWPSLHGWKYTVEQIDSRSVNTILKNHEQGSWQFANDLQPNADYAFRVIAHSPDDGFIPSDYLSYKHIVPRSGGRDNNIAPLITLPTPLKPFLANKTDSRKVELGWRQARDVTYHVEGSASFVGGRYEWRTVYKGLSTQLLLTDEHTGLIFFRIQHIAKRHNMTTSEWSDVLRISVPVKPLVYRIPALLTPAFSEITKHSMRISWQPAEHSPLVPGTTVLYELRRIDSVSQLLYSGPDSTYTMESMRPRQQISVQVRIVAVDGSGKRREGEWSSIGTATTMRDAPHPPHSLALSHDRKELHWEVAEELGGDVTYAVSRTTVGEEGCGTEVHFEASTCKLCLSDLAPGVTYAFQVVARCPWGESAPSEMFRMSTAAEVPTAPEPMFVEAEAQRELTVRWTPPEGRGSAIRAYHIKIEHDRQIVRESMMPAPNNTMAYGDELEYRVEGLQPDTAYRVYVAASNDVGIGASAKAECRTRRPPPPPPALEGEAEPTQIKLRWRAPGQSTTRYHIARLNDTTDAHVPCYEGEYCSTKIKGLQENSSYRFQIRSFDRETGSGPWSEIFTFRTPLAPPPTIRGVPVATANGNGTHTIDWPSVIPKGNPRGLFYRVQTHASSDKKDQWKTVYEGGVNSFTLRLQPESSLLTRVFVVRPDGGTGIVSQPSPPLHVSSIGLPKQEEECEVVEVKTSLAERLQALLRSGRVSLFAMTFAFLAIFSFCLYIASRYI